jgi:TolB protein
VRTLAALLAAVALAAAAAAADAAPSADGLIAFSRCRPDSCDLGTDIWLIRKDATGLVRLTRDGTHNDGPSWSPDGKRIAFASGDFASGQIWTMNADGSDRREVTRSKAFDGQPAWSPDGRRIAFVRTFSEARHQIYVIDLARGSARQITHEHGTYRHPAWSPDGRRIAFSYARNAKTGRYGVYVMRADGSGRRKLTPNDRDDYLDPAWSPDGGRIVFSRDAASGKSYAAHLETIDAGGGNRRVLLRAPRGTLYFGASWSPDGKELVFVRFQQKLGVGQLSFVNADGTGSRVFTNILGNNGTPAWRPS